MSVNGKKLAGHDLIAELNKIGGRHGVGIALLVENRLVGMKSRGMYETPGGEIYARAHRGIEQITLDRGAAHLKDELMPRYAELIYNGFWFAPERETLQRMIDDIAQPVTGTARLRLFKGGVTVLGRKAPRRRRTLPASLASTSWPLSSLTRKFPPFAIKMTSPSRCTSSSLLT